MEPASTISNATTSATFNHLVLLFCTGGTDIAGDGTGCPAACGDAEGPGRVAGIDVLAGPGGMASAGCDDSTVGLFISSCAGICIGADHVGVIGKAGVEDELTGDGCSGGRIGVLLAATTGGTNGALDCDSSGDWLRYVGLFIVSRWSLSPPRDGGLRVPRDGRA